ncbi:MAG: hypothetical protein L0Y38_03335 [Methylococcaceae bacterium]|nr:hypothetical protein [Methylococcaceae bacterium]
MASRLAHEVVYHGVHVQSLNSLVAVFVAAVVALCVAPLLVFIPGLAAAKRTAPLEYGALIGEHGRLVHRRWIRREAIEESALLDAPEIGPVADTLSLYEAVMKMRMAPDRQDGAPRRRPARLAPDAGLIRDRDSHQGTAAQDRRDIDLEGKPLDRRD